MNVDQGEKLSFLNSAEHSSFHSVSDLARDQKVLVQGKTECKTRKIPGFTLLCSFPIDLVRKVAVALQVAQKRVDPEAEVQEVQSLAVDQGKFETVKT